MKTSRGNRERTSRHWIIAANNGDDRSMKSLGGSYANGHVRKEDFVAALRAAENASTSP